jgi:hypothetical protein
MRNGIAAVAAVAALAAALPALAQSQAGAPASTGAASSTAATAPASSAALAVGQPVKDKTGVVIGEITELKPGAGGQQATVKMGDQSFTIGAQSFVVQNGAAVINATQQELKSMIANAAKAG